MINEKENKTEQQLLIQKIYSEKASKLLKIIMRAFYGKYIYISR